MRGILGLVMILGVVGGFEVFDDGAHSDAVAARGE